MIRDLILKNRSYRRFNAAVKISDQQALAWIDLARFSASGRNAQPLKYTLVTQEEKCDEIFPHLAWAGYLADWDGPAPDERPVAYVLVLKDHRISEKHYCDDGLAMQNILLGAVEDGYGGCILGAINRKKVAELAGLDENLEILWIIALGKPAEDVVIETAEGDIKYWRDEQDIHHVPKRSLEDILVKIKD